VVEDAGPSGFEGEPGRVFIVDLAEPKRHLLGDEL
jgi:hypothetical protein